MHKDCRKVRDLLPLYSVQGLDERTARGIVAHLESCPGCHREWVLLQKTVALMDNMEDREPPGDLWPGIAQHLQTAAQPSGPGLGTSFRLSFSSAHSNVGLGPGGTSSDGGHPGLASAIPARQREGSYRQHIHLAIR